jgi:hypothetical protein
MSRRPLFHLSLAVFLIAGCTGGHGYKIIGLKNYFDPKQDGGSGGLVIQYTISHDGNTIRARCQAFR